MSSDSSIANKQKNLENILSQTNPLLDWMVKEIRKFYYVGLDNDDTFTLDGSPKGIDEKVNDAMIPIILSCIDLFEGKVKRLKRKMQKIYFETYDEHRLHNNRITSKGASMIFNHLDQTRITRLSLYDNLLDDACIIAFGEFLQRSTIFEAIFIGKNRITDEGIKTLSKFMVGNTSFKELSLYAAVDISDAAYPSFELIANQSAVNRINVGLTRMSDKNQALLERLVKEPLDKRNIPGNLIETGEVVTKDLIKIPSGLKMKSNRCEILERIGDGGFSFVYKMKMRNPGLNDSGFLVFKQFLITADKTSSKDIELIENEIDILSYLSHDNIVKIIGAIGDPNTRDINNERMGVGIVMEYCENGSLRSLLNKSTNYQQPLNMDLIIHLLFGAAQGLEYLHNHIPRAVIHGDIKSDNILIDKEYNAKLCDFGISKLQQTTSASSTRGSGGTLGYKAPETYDDNYKIDIKSDVYSFGCVILETLTGEIPWNGFSVAQITKKVTVDKKSHDLSKVRVDVNEKEELIDLMKRCLDYDKDKRPTMNEVRAELERMMNNAVLIELDNKSNEYNKVENLFFPGEDKEGSLNRKKYSIVKIDKIRHLFAERRYDAELTNVKSLLNNDNANEILLFHGTSETDPMMILNHPDAFMKDYASQGFYGKGLYFAELARYSNAGYRYNIPSSKQYQLLVCSIICGKSIEWGFSVTDETRILSHQDLGSEYHSIHAGPHRPSKPGKGEDDSCMYVIYKDNQVLPKYLITYENI